MIGRNLVRGRGDAYASGVTAGVESSQQAIQAAVTQAVTPVEKPALMTQPWFIPVVILAVAIIGLVAWFTRKSKKRR